MNQNLLLDTNILIDAERRYLPMVAFVNSIRNEDLAISLVTYGEVLQGTLWVPHSPTAIQKLEQNIEGMQLLPVTKAIMQRYAYLRGSLRTVGIVIATADAIIAATAIETRRMLVTRNVRHFASIQGLEILDPLGSQS